MWPIPLPQPHFELQYPEAKSMTEHRVNIGVMGLPSLKHALQKHARREGRTTSNLAERLLVWAVRELQRAGDSQILLRWQAQPPGSRKAPFSGLPDPGLGIDQKVKRRPAILTLSARDLAEGPADGNQGSTSRASQEVARHSRRPRRREHP